ncbi:MAG TPA: hypothetical protein VFP65_01225 [Anaeromyxobacteraceae bacterium]|nr:hypothetical protein [Anaeromyxobacteraceae bacterium]
MIWFLMGGAVLTLALRLRRRRRELFAVLPSYPFSTLHLELAKRQGARTRAALAVATAALR